MTRSLMILLLVAACADNADRPRASNGGAETAAPPHPEIAALSSPHEDVRHDACIALGRRGDAQSREALLAVLAAPSPDPKVDGPNRLYAAAGLTMLADPASAVRLVESL